MPTLHSPVPWPNKLAVAALGGLIVTLSVFDDDPRPAPVTPARRVMARGTTESPALHDFFNENATNGDAAHSDPHQATGIALVERYFADRTPTGRGVAMMHVEAGADFAPRLTGFGGVELLVLPLWTGRASKISGHADATARLIYGPCGLAPGVGHVAFVNNWAWIAGRCLRADSLEPPTASGCRVMSHSWAFSGGPMDVLVLRRLDYLIEHDNVIVVAGVDNGGHSAVPGMIASAYNAIAVGVTRRSSSGGGTQADGAGRRKPELVADMSRTSYATPVVAAVAARLVEAANHRAMFPPTELGNRAGDVLRVEVIKAVMLAGADKSVGFEPAEGSPLDAHHGAGAVRFDRSLQVLWNGPISRPAQPLTHSPTHLAAQSTPIDQFAGWDYRAIMPDEVVTYALTVPAPLKQLSIAAVWNRHVDGWDLINPTLDAQGLAPLPLADIDLRVIRPRREGNVILARSTSSVDNLEHLHLRDVQPGIYHIDLRRKDDLSATEHVAIAWWSQVDSR